MSEDERWSILLADGTTYVGCYDTEAEADKILLDFGFSDECEVVPARYAGRALPNPELADG